MKLEHFLSNVSLQSDCKVVYFDYDKQERIEVNVWESVLDKRILYVYVEDDVLYLEVDIDV